MKSKVEERIPIVRIIFKSKPDLILLRSEYDKYKNLFGFSKEYNVSLKDIYRAKSELINPKDFPKTAWEG